MMRRYLKYISVCILTMLAVSCQQDEPLDLNEKVMVSYSVRMPARDASRVAIDGSKVNTLIVEVFEKEGETWRSAYRSAGISVSGGSADVTIPLLKHRPYRVVFWAQNNNVTAYDTDDLSHISLDYTHYSNGFESVENLDAFYYVDEVKGLESTSNDNVKVELKRPFVFLNIDNQSEYTPVSTTLTIKKAYTSFYPLTGVMGNAIQNQEFEFTGAKEDGTIAACLVFVSPSENSLDVSLEISNGTSVTTKDVTIEAVKANHRYNLKGELVGAPMSHWNEKTELPYYDEANNRYIIQNEAQLAWWMNPVAEELNEGATEIFIEKNLDMQDIPMDALQLPEGITLNGNDKTIERLNLSGGLLGNATNLKVHNLTISQAEVVATSGHVGVLVNTLTSSSTFTGVTVTNSSATTSNGAAGGMVGYILRNTIDDRDETLTVIFSNCNLVGVTADGTESEGKFVGLLSGYDNGETLAFDANCSATDITLDYESPYKNVNQSVWLDAVDTKFDGWLGTETYHRGNVTFDGKRLVPKWDGTTNTIEPIYEDTNKKIAQIWSPFDLAYLQGKSLATLDFKENVDLGGRSCDDCITAGSDELCTNEECNHFTPIVSLNNLKGNKKTLYNLNIQGVHVLQGDDNYGMGFICQTKEGTFENFTFDGAIIRCIDIISLRNDPKNGGNAYAGTLTSRVYGKMTINNVHAKNGHVIGISKFGGLIGYVSGGIEATECTVDNYVIENHKINVTNSYSIVKYLGGEGPDDSSLRASCSENFYTEGEAGGFIGFISSNSTITDCHTSNITMKCYGQEDRETKILGEMKMSLLGKTYWTDLMKIPYTIAGRHVNTFIGDIRTPSANIITINECTASGSYDSGYDSDITKTGKGELVGCCYFVGKDITLGNYTMHEGDYKGTVTIDGEKMPFVGG